MVLSQNQILEENKRRERRRKKDKKKREHKEITRRCRCAETKGDTGRRTNLLKL
jgi:hypothetical protein